ncbi:MAG TPA: histone deacetylase [Thermoanaerobaculia bacterium]|nr:histone deacetylase [Thermoanaerobaculia bacterium]
MKAFYCDHFVLPLPEGHRFPMEKYSRLRERAQAAGVLARGDLIVPHAATDEEILRVHDAEYLRRVMAGELDRAEARRIGFPWSPAMVERSRRSAGGTIEACRAALEEGAAVNLAGGTHHAFRDRGEGYCVFNDAAIASRAVQAEGLAGRVVVIDCDVHQGNGTAAIFADDPTVFTFSIHGRNNFPFHKERSDLDVGLPDGTADEEYLAALEEGLGRALPAARADLAIYVSGADPHERDRLGRLKVSRAGLRERDRLVLAFCRRAGLPVAAVMAGGYNVDVAETVEIHLQTMAEARRHAEIWGGFPLESLTGAHPNPTIGDDS